MTETRVERWLHVASGAPVASHDVSRRRILVRSVAVALAVGVLISIGSLLAARWVAESEAVRIAAGRGDLLAVDVVQPAITTGLPAGDKDAVAHLDAKVRTSVLGATVARVKVWNGDGSIVYSDERSLIGRTYTLDAKQTAAFQSDNVQAEVADLSAPQDRYERGLGQLLEVSRAVHTPNGTPLLLEIYFRYDAVSADAWQIGVGFGVVTAASLIVLGVTLASVVGSLMRALERSRRQREELLVRAVEASDAERRRIAASVHDGPVQDLVGASYQIGGAAFALVDTDAGRTLEAAEVALNTTIEGLRSMLVDIYPAALAEGGLGMALADLVSAARSRGAAVVLRGDPTLALSPNAERLVFRIVRETLANAVKHGGGDGMTSSGRCQS